MRRRQGSGSGKSARAQEADEPGRARAYAFRLLGYRQRSEKELKQRLRMKGFPPGVAEATVEKLKETGYIDDRSMAGSLRLMAEERKMLGLTGARQYIRRMGISQSDADEVLEGYDENAGAMKLAQKKMNSLSGYPPRVARQKLMGHLRRRGFSGSTARKIINEFIKED